MDTKEMQGLSINQIKSAMRGRAGRIKVLEAELKILDYMLADKIGRGSFEEPKRKIKVKGKPLDPDTFKEME